MYKMVQDDDFCHHFSVMALKTQSEKVRSWQMKLYQIEILSYS